MAKRELSSNLKNLKFMQRAVQKQEKTKSEQELKLDGAFVSVTTQSRKCVVLMEGNPHPGALKGRMSFQSFNPSIDQLNEAAANLHQSQTSTSSYGNQDDQMPNRDNGFPETKEESVDIVRAGGHSSSDHKRKHAETESKQKSPSPFKSVRNVNGEASRQTSSDNRKGSFKQPKHEKLDWNVLRPPKPSGKGS